MKEEEKINDDEEKIRLRYERWKKEKKRTSANTAGRESRAIERGLRRRSSIITSLADDDDGCKKKKRTQYAVTCQRDG
jgi:hypothetical protein